MYSPGSPYIVVAPVVTSWAVAGQRMVFSHMFLQARVTLEAFPIVAPRGRSSKFPWRGTNTHDLYNVILEIVDVHHRAIARWAFVIKKYIHLHLFFGEWMIVSLDKTLIPRLGLGSTSWSCIETAIWIFNLLIPIEVHYMEKNPGTFSSKTFISFWLMKDMNILDDTRVSK